MARKRSVGRPRKNHYPDPIDDTPENIAKAILDTPPKTDDEWAYLREVQPPPAHT